MGVAPSHLAGAALLMVASCASPVRPPVRTDRDVQLVDPFDASFPRDDAGPDAGRASDASVDDVAVDGAVDRAPPPGPPPGLRLIGFGDVTMAAHSREIVVDGDYVYLADANGLPVLRMLPGGGLALAHAITPERAHHCSTASLHAATHTLVCGAGDTGYLDFIDVRDPTSPRPNPWSINHPGDEPPIYEVHDVEVSGDTLWMVAGPNGLLRIPLGADGRPGSLVRTHIGMSSVGVVAGGGRLALIDRTLGLVMLSERDLSTLGTAALDGPPLDVVMSGDRVAVALGSSGVRVFRLVDGAPTMTASLQPHCVATGVALSGDQLAVSCLSGVTLYDLASSPPRVAGYAPARFGMLDALFGPRGLLVADWFGVQHFATDPAGVVEVPDVTTAARLQPGADARIVVRNPANEPLTFGWRLQQLTLPPVRQETLTVPASGVVTLTLPTAQLEAAGSRAGAADLYFYRNGGAPSPGDNPTSVTSRTRIVQRDPTDLPARGVVAIGDRFPTLTRTHVAPSPATLPLPGAATLVAFVTVDCYLQWPQLEDMAWSLSHGMGTAPTVLYLTTRFEDPWYPNMLVSSHGASNLLTVQWGAYSRSVPGQEMEDNPVSAFEHSYYMHMPGADFPHDYLVDATGVVRDTMRMYRGRWNPQP